MPPLSASEDEQQAPEGRHRPTGSEPEPGLDRPEGINRDEALDQQGAKPLSAGENASLDQMGAGLGEDKDNPSATSRTVGAAAGQGSPLTKFLLKNAKSKKNLLIGGGIGAAFVVPILVLLLFLSLFKLTDVEKLFFDWEFAKVHNVLRQRAGELADEAKDTAKGTANSEVNPDDPLTTQIDDLNASELDTIASDPAQLSDVADSLENVELSDVGIGAVTDSEFGISRDISDIEEEPGETEDQMDRAVEKSDQEAVQAGETIDPNAPLSGDAQNVEDAIKAGATPEAAIANAAQSIKFYSAAENLSLAAIISTFWCIGRDVFVQGVSKLEMLNTQNLARSAARINTAADAERKGDLSVGQVGAYNHEFDNNGQSFTQSTAYYKDTNQTPPASAVPLDPAALPFPNATGGLFTIFNTLNFLTGIPGEGIVCNVLLNPAGQIGVATGSLVLTALGALVSGGQDVTVSAVATQTLTQLVKSLTYDGAIKAGASVGAVEGFKYLAASLVADEAGANVTGTEGPAEKGGVMDAGDDVLQTESLRLIGGRALTGTESSTITKSEVGYEQEHSYSTLARVFDPKDLYSPTSELLARIPTDPSTAVIDLGHFASASLSFSNLLHTIGSLVSNVTPGAKADTTGCDPTAANGSCDPYGITQYGFTDGELAQYPPLTNAQYIEANPSIAQTYGQCFQPSSTNTLDNPTLTAANGDTCNDPSNTQLTRYRLYLLDKQVVWDMAVLYNSVPGNAVAPQ